MRLNNKKTGYNIPDMKSVSPKCFLSIQMGLASHTDTASGQRTVQCAVSVSQETCGTITIWLVGCWGRLRIMASISSNFLRASCTSEWSSLYSAYWSLNTARYWSRSSLVRIAGYLLQRESRKQHVKQMWVSCTTRKLL